MRWVASGLKRFLGESYGITASRFQKNESHIMATFQEHLTDEHDQKLLPKLLLQDEEQQAIRRKSG